MIERMTDMPPGALGVRVTDELERSDYTDVVVPMMQGRSTRAKVCERST